MTIRQYIFHGNVRLHLATPELCQARNRASLVVLFVNGSAYFDLSWEADEL